MNGEFYLKISGQLKYIVGPKMLIRNKEKLLFSLCLYFNMSFFFRQSYDVTMDLCIEGNEQTRSINTLDLKNPYFRYTGQPVAPPPGTSGTSPSEAYWNQLDAQGARQGISQPISNYFIY